MRISDWSSDVCSSDLAPEMQQAGNRHRLGRRITGDRNGGTVDVVLRSHRSGFGDRERQFEAEGRSPARLRAHIDRTAHQVEQAPAYGEAEPGTAVVPCGRHLGLAEGLEQPAQPLRSEEGRVGKEDVSTGRSRWW